MLATNDDAARRGGIRPRALLLGTAALLCAVTFRPAHGDDPSETGAARAADLVRYDRAVVALRERISGRAENAALARRVEQRIGLARERPSVVAARLRARMEALQIVPLRVPGLFYRAHPWTGADLSSIEATLGRPVALVETGEVDSVERNAATIAAALRAAPEDGQALLVFSASKGSADLHQALLEDPSLAGRVALWIDLVGLIAGTPLTDPGIAPEEIAALGLPAPTARSMSAAARALSARAPLPASVRAVHVVGFPTSGAISPAAQAGFERLRPFGPNDGFLLLETFLHAPGRVLAVRDADHYLRVADVQPQLLALLSALLDEVAGERSASADARAGLNAALPAAAAAPAAPSLDRSAPDRPYASAASRSGR